MAKNISRILIIFSLLLLISGGTTAGYFIYQKAQVRSIPLVVSYDENDFDEIRLKLLLKEEYTCNHNENDSLIEIEITYKISFVGDTDDDPNTITPSYTELENLFQEITQTSITNSANHTVVFSFANGKVLKTLNLSLESGVVFALTIPEKEPESLGQGKITVRFLLLSID